MGYHGHGPPARRPPARGGVRFVGDFKKEMAKKCPHHHDREAAVVWHRVAQTRSPRVVDRSNQQLQPQHTGMPPSIMQHIQPAFMHMHMQSQQACSISHIALSPQVQVMHTPSFIMLHSHLHMAMLHWHMTMPFIMQHMLIMPPAIILHMF
jgi:hypothetical protein